MMLQLVMQTVLEHLVPMYFKYSYEKKGARKKPEFVTNKYFGTKQVIEGQIM